MERTDKTSWASIFDRCAHRARRDGSAEQRPDGAPTGLGSQRHLLPGAPISKLMQQTETHAHMHLLYMYTRKYKDHTRASCGEGTHRDL